MIRAIACVVLAAATVGACGDDHQAPDAPQIDSAIDAPPQGPTLTTFVIDLVQNKTADNTDAVAFDQFSTLPDPDGDNNNTAAYNPLFP